MPQRTLSYVKFDHCKKWKMNPYFSIEYILESTNAVSLHWKVSVISEGDTVVEPKVICSA